MPEFSIQRYSRYDDMEGSIRNNRYNENRLYDYLRDKKNAFGYLSSSGSGVRVTDTYRKSGRRLAIRLWSKAST
jgi:hypothetical protein